MEEPEREPLLDTEEIARFLNVKVASVRRYVKYLGLPAFRVGNQYRFDKQQVKQWLEAQRREGREA